MRFVGVGLKISQGHRGFTPLPLSRIKIGLMGAGGEGVQNREHGNIEGQGHEKSGFLMGRQEKLQKYAIFGNLYLISAKTFRPPLKSF